jgi:hypothetical protein
MFCQIKSTKELTPFLIEWLSEKALKMVRKCGDPQGTAELFMRNVMHNLDSGNAFLLLHASGPEEGRKEIVLDAFMFAVYIGGTAKFVEFIGTWTAPGIGKKFRFEGNKLFEAWARNKGAKRIMAGITRGGFVKAQHFYKFFHQPLDYKITGIIIEKELT